MMPSPPVALISLTWKGSALVSTAASGHRESPPEGGGVAAPWWA
jgi:hypothetical protein